MSSPFDQIKPYLDKKIVDGMVSAAGDTFIILEDGTFLKVVGMFQPLPYSTAPSDITDIIDCARYQVVLKTWGNNKIGTIKAVREIRSLGLREAKELVESAPCVIVAHIESIEDARHVLKTLRNITDASYRAPEDQPVVFEIEQMRS